MVEVRFENEGTVSKFIKLSIIVLLTLLSALLSFFLNSNLHCVILKVTTIKTKIVEKVIKL